MRKIIYTLLFIITSTIANAQCPDPSNLIVPIITETSANLEWTENGTATSWEVEVVIAGSTPTGVGVTVNTIPYTAIGLMSGTDYEFYVTSNCPSGGNSSWVGPFSFTTFPCDFTIVAEQNTDACLEYCFLPAGSQFGTFFDFNSGLLPTGWDSSPYTVGTPCWTDMIDNTPYFWAGVTNSNGVRFVTTNILDVSLGGTIEFYMRYGAADPDPGCEDPDLVDEGVFLQYSIDNGANWVTINTWNPTGNLSDPMYSWIQYTENIPVAAQTPNTTFRWYQPQNSGPEYDNWGLDNVSITANTEAEFDWDFGDGSVAVDQLPCHTFDAPGDYVVSLLVTAPNCVSSQSVSITVVDDILPIVVCQDLSLNVDGTGSVTITPADIDNGSTDNCAIQTMTLSQTVFDCTDVGQNTVTLTVTDIYGNVNTCDATVSVSASNPGTNGAISLCGNSGTVDLFDLLGGTPGTGGTWSPSLTSGTGVFDPLVDIEGVYVYTASACSSAGASVTVTVNDTPQINSLSNQDVCVSYTLPTITGVNLSGNEQYYTQPNGGGTAYSSGTVLSYLDFSSYPTTLYIYDESGTTPNCVGNEVSFELSITLIAFNAIDIEMCDDDLDGFLLFDLTLNTAGIIGAQADTFVTYHESQADADAGTPFINSPSAYQNLVASPPFSSQTIYARIENSNNGCYDTVAFEIMLNTPVFNLPEPLYSCDDDNDSFGYFNLNDATSHISGGNSNIEVTYYETLAEAHLGEAMGANIDTSVPYQNLDTDGDGTGDIQTLYINVLDTSTNCFYVGIELQDELELHVIKSPELPSEDVVYNQCEESPDISDGIVVFDLTAYEETYLYTEIIDIAGGDATVMNQYTAAYYTSLLASGNPDPVSLIGTPNAFENQTTPDQIIYVEITHTGDATVVGTGCSTVKEITLHVDLLPTALFTPIDVCDDNDVNDLNNNISDGFIEFNLTEYISVITNGATDITTDFYTNQADAEVGFGVSLIPNPENFTNTVNPQDVFARVFNPITGCYAVAIVRLHVNSNPTPLSNEQIIATLGNNGVMEECDGNVDGSGAISEQVAEFNLTQWEIDILNGEVGVTASYYTNIDDAAIGNNEITNATNFSNTSNPQTIYMSVINDGYGLNPISEGTGCYTIVEFQLFVPVPEVEVVADKNVICIDENGVHLTNTSLPLLTATAGPIAAAAYNYQWELNGLPIAGATNQMYTATEPGDYTVIVSGPTDLDCVNRSFPITIEASGIPDDFDANVTTNAFADSHEIVAEATSNIPGIVFWYSLDGGEPTTDGTFTNVSPGIHTVTISDGKNCWSKDEIVTIIDYPHFFTPNGDGINDTWAIIGQEGIPISQVYIFNRFGKLIAQLDPDGEGWDGTYNGNQVPATDYWFKIIYIEGADSTQKEYKAHFSLKR